MHCFLIKLKIWNVGRFVEDSYRVLLSDRLELYFDAFGNWCLEAWGTC